MKKVLWIASAGIGVLAAGVVDSHSQPLVDSNIWAPTIAMKCTVNCWDGFPGCSAGQHMAPLGEPAMMEDGDGDHSGCFTGSCDDKHPFCQETLLEGVERLRVALLDGNARAVKRVLHELGTDVEINGERSALQVIGCDGLVAMHIPVASEFLQTLVE